MDEAGFLADAFCHGAEEGGHVMMGLLEEFLHALEVEAGHLDLGQRLARDDALFDPGLAHGDLDIEPLGKLVFFAPDLFHLGPAVTFDHGLVSF